MTSTFALGLATMVAGGGEGPAPAIVDAKFELFVANVEDSIRFYEALGFGIAHHKPDGSTTLRSGSTVVALSPVPSWLRWLSWLAFLRHPPVGTEIVLYTEHLGELRAAIAAAGYQPGAITLQSWGDRDFRVTDPDGYYVRVSEGSSVPRPE